MRRRYAQFNCISLGKHGRFVLIMQEKLKGESTEGGGGWGMGTCPAASCFRSCGVAARRFAVQVEPCGCDLVSSTCFLNVVWQGSLKGKGVWSQRKTEGRTAAQLKETITLKIYISVYFPFLDFMLLLLMLGSVGTSDTEWTLT